MPGTIGNKNALKHGLYARHFTRQDRSELANMPVDQVLMEIAALRLTADRAIAVIESTEDVEQKMKAIQASVASLKAIANLIARTKLLSGDSPVLQELWTAVDNANKKQGWKNDL